MSKHELMITHTLLILSSMSSYLTYTFFKHELMLTHTLLILSPGAVMNMVANETNSLKFGKGVLVSDPTKGFIAALAPVLGEQVLRELVLYSCFTHA